MDEKNPAKNTLKRPAAKNGNGAAHDAPPAADKPERKAAARGAKRNVASDVASGVVVNELLPPPSEEAQLRALLDAMEAANLGDFKRRLPVYGTHPLVDRLAEAFNTGVSLNAALTHEMVRVERVVGREGRMTERVNLGNVRGDWATSVNSINALIGDLVQPTTEVARVLVAVAEGDLTQKMALEIDGQQVKGEFLRIGTTVNAMVDQLSAFAAEVTRVAKEVGSDGKLSAKDVEAALKNREKEAKDVTHGVAVRIDARYVEGGAERRGGKDYILRYKWEGGGLFGGRSLRLIGISR